MSIPGIEPSISDSSLSQSSPQAGRGNNSQGQGMYLGGHDHGEIGMVKNGIEEDFMGVHGYKPFGSLLHGYDSMVSLVSHRNR